VLPDSTDKVDWRTQIRRSVAFFSDAPLHWVYVAGLWAAGIVIPIACFGLGGVGPPDPPSWQSGAISDYAMLMLDLKVSTPLLPLLIFAMICFGIALAKPKVAKERFWVRMGVLSGVLLSIHFGIVLGFAFSGTNELLSERGLTTLLVLPLGAVAGIAFGFIGLTLLWVLDAGTHVARTRNDGWGVFTQVVINVIAAVLLFATGVLPVIIFGCLFFGPALSLAAYTFVFVRATRQQERSGRFTLWRMSGLITWLAAYFAATRAAVELTMIEYAKLPTQPSNDCYIATVASQGNPRVVKGFEIVDSRGEPKQINHQLAYFKCGELALKTCLPRCHRLVRTLYDKVGPTLASWLRQHGGAEVSYLLLKPIEWFVRCLLFTLLRDYRMAAMQLYRSHNRTTP